MQLYNTLTRQSESFTPLTDNTVALYTCGLTVYSQPHIGNWVAYICWDALVRTLQASGYTVNHVQNITDVGHLTSDEDAGEDKMLKGALREGLNAWQVAEKYISVAHHEAYELLGLTPPTHMPRATEYIEQQIAFVEELEARGFTYIIDDGVYFDTSKLSDYGKLARLDIDGLQFGARVADSGKKNPTDFAVWKFSHPSEKRDMEWDSKWGRGFPGWHLECSVMARELLGDQIDIHCGGIDHIPVHHTNEIAQTEAITNKPFSQFWVHANHIKVNGTKMSKSLGNIYTLNDITQKGFDVQAFKLLVLSKHYRTEGNFTWDILSASANRLNRWLSAIDLRWQTYDTQAPQNGSLDLHQTILSALQDDLGTPAAISAIDSFIDRVEALQVTPDEIIKDATAIHELLGIDLLRSSTDITSEQQSLLTERGHARQNKDWAKADELRDRLLADDIAVRDASTGQLWNRVRT